MLFIFGYHSTCNVRSFKLHCTFPCMEILGRPWIFLKVALYDAKSNIPWHDCPSPVYPSLQVHLWEPSVLVQFAVTSQAWLLLRHSSISSSTNDIYIYRILHRKSVCMVFTHELVVSEIESVIILGGIRFQPADIILVPRSPHIKYRHWSLLTCDLV